MGALACGLAALLLAGTGAGAKDLQTTLQDDAMLLHRPPAQVRSTARTIAALGVDRVRLTAGWSAIAPAPRARTKPGAPFVAHDPSTYPKGAWDGLDTAVAAAHDAGLDVMIDIAFWAPRWAVRRGGTNPGRERYMPDPAEFAAFAEAVVRRYGDTVTLYTTWNEPNHPSFLAPQWYRTPNGGYRPASPHIYRAMHEAAYDAIKRVRPGVRVLLGGTASTGGEPGKGGVPPLQFVREMACVDERLQPLRVPECRHFRPLHADGYAHHPYARYTDPAVSDPDPDDAPLADTGRLTQLLQALSLRGRIAGTPLPLYATEFGYETREDDPYAPFGRAEQARFLAKASFEAWKQPGLQMFAQFLLRDVSPAESGRAPGSRSFYRDWQSGLYDAQGRPKPALQAFRLPFWAELHEQDGARVILAWGLVRPAHGRTIVRVEQQTAAGAWEPVRSVGAGECGDGQAEFLTDPTGAFLVTLPAGAPASYRMAWRRDDGTWEPSLPVSAP